MTAKEKQLREALEKIQRLLAHSFTEGCDCAWCEAYRVAERALTEKTRKA